MKKTISLPTPDVAESKLQDLYRQAGYLPYRMSKFEEYDLYARNREFLQSPNIITFTDADGSLRALKPDVTLSIAKNAAGTDGLTKVFYSESVYRPDRSTNMFREITQTGLECIGPVDGYCMAEVLFLAVKSLETLCPECVLDVSFPDLLTKAFKKARVKDEDVPALMKAFCAKSPHTLSSILDGSGVSGKDAEILLKLLAAEGEPKKVLPGIRALYKDEDWTGAVDEYLMILSVLPQKRACVDFSAAGSLTYYNGIVFRGFLKGIPDCVLSGGRYDLLMERLGQKKLAIGFAVYLDACEALLRRRQDYDLDVLLLYTENDSLKDVFKAVQSLSADGSRVRAAKEADPAIRARTVMKLFGDGRIGTC